MVSRRSGGIINVASTAAFLPVPFAAVYSASKSFVLDFSEALHGELGEHGVRVLALCPGGTQSNFAAVAVEGSASSASKLASQDAPQDVAEAGLEALVAGRSCVVPGRTNYAMSLLPRVLPRETVIRLSGQAWRRTIGR
jgi:short-subunit dehydrogenase